MFATAAGGNVWGGLGPPPENLLDRERSPPARPIPLTFPNYAPPRTVPQPLNQRLMSTVRKSLLSIRSPNDVKEHHFSNLNVQYKSDVSLTDFVPPGHFEARPFLYDNDLSSMLNELEYTNKDAFREVLRLPPLDGTPKPRLTYSRNFFYSLEDMSRYWDSSLDKYYFVPIEGDDNDKTDYINPIAKSHVPRTSKPIFDEQMVDVPAECEEKEHSTPVSTPPPTSKSARIAQSSTKALKSPSNSSSKLVSEEPPQNSNDAPPGMKEVYRGYRLGSGAQMSPGSRVGAVRNLLKMVIYRFNCRDYDLSPRERLRIKDINIPIPIGLCNFSVMKIPADPKLARGRFLEGPVLGISCRPEVKWSTSEHVRSSNNTRKKFSVTDEGETISEKFDLLREVGGMLFIAIQRAREGRTKDTELNLEEQQSWWTSKERWGGGPTKWGQLANEVFEDDDPSWSPTERQLQLQKRAQDEETEKRISRVEEQVHANNMAIEDLLAGNKMSRNERPKKKNRLDLRNIDTDPAKKEDNSKVESKDGRRLIYTPAVRKRWYRDWLKLRPNTSLWDEKIIYKRTGTEGPYDSVYQISSLNHHVCLMKMEIHEKYTEWLEKGVIIFSEAAEADHQLLKISRSKWFDLFDIEQRKEFVTALWKLMCWINRNDVPKSEYAKMEELRKEKEEQQNENEGGDDVMDTS